MMDLVEIPARKSSVEERSKGLLATPFVSCPAEATDGGRDY